MKNTNIHILAGLTAITLAVALPISAIQNPDNVSEVVTTETTVEETTAVETAAEIIETVKETTAEEMTVPELIYWDAFPLSPELQDHIVRECEKVNVEPFLIFAMIECESSYQFDAVGDGGKSYGLMQIQLRYHRERMKRLNADNLLNPYQNVTVGIDIISELISKYDTIGEAVTCYNAGEYGAEVNYFSKGVYMNGYARKVLTLWEEYRIKLNTQNTD